MDGITLNAAPLIALTIAKCEFDTPVGNMPPTHYKQGFYIQKTASEKLFEFTKQSAWHYSYLLLA